MNMDKPSSSPFGKNPQFLLFQVAVSPILNESMPNGRISFGVRLLVPLRIFSAIVKHPKRRRTPNSKYPPAS
jgi:hypothetical protein